MRSLISSLWHETRSRFQRLPVWLPGTPMELGDVGIFADSGWEKRTTLAGLGITFSADPAGEPVDYDYHSQDGAQVTTSISASGTPVLEAVVQGNLGMHIGFSRAGAFVLKAGSVTVRRMAELADVDEQILRRYPEQRWRPNWVVVTEVARGGPSITVVSGSSAGEAVIDLGAAVAPAGPVLGAGFGVRSTKGLAASFVALTETTLLWRGRCVQDRWWSSEPRLRDRGIQSDESGWDGGADDGAPDDAVPQVVDIEYPEDLPSSQGSGPVMPT